MIEEYVALEAITPSAGGLRIVQIVAHKFSVDTVWFDIHQVCLRVINRKVIVWKARDLTLKEGRQCLLHKYIRDSRKQSYYSKFFLADFLFRLPTSRKVANNNFINFRLF